MEAAAETTKIIFYLEKIFENYFIKKLSLMRREVGRKGRRPKNRGLRFLSVRDAR